MLNHQFLLSENQKSIFFLFLDTFFYNATNFTNYKASEQQSV